MSASASTGAIRGPFKSLCLQQQGKVAEGLRAYQRWRKVLADRLGICPSTAAEAVRRALCSRLPTPFRPLRSAPSGGRS